MIHKIIIIIYALISIASSIAYFYQQRTAHFPLKKSLAMGGFFIMHLLLCIIGITLFMYTIPASVLALCLLMAWFSRIGNGIIVFKNVHVPHHIVSAFLFIILFIGFHFNL